MRTDLYAVLMTGTGCVNLWRVNRLYLLAWITRLTTAQQQELAEAHPRDLQVARWYVFVYAIGLALAGAFFVAYFLPATIRLLDWLWRTIAAAELGRAEFWAALLFSAIVISPQVITLAVAGRDLARYSWKICWSRPS